MSERKESQDEQHINSVAFSATIHRLFLAIKQIEDYRTCIDTLSLHIYRSTSPSDFPERRREVPKAPYNAKFWCLRWKNSFLKLLDAADLPVLSTVSKLEVVDSEKEDRNIEAASIVDLASKTSGLSNLVFWIHDQRKHGLESRKVRREGRSRRDLFQMSTVTNVDL